MQLMPSTAKQAAAELGLDFEPSQIAAVDINLKLGANSRTHAVALGRRLGLIR